MRMWLFLTQPLSAVGRTGWQNCLPALRADTLFCALLKKKKKSNSPFCVFYFLIVLILVFWILDGYFLSQERSYRDLYNHVRKLKEEEVDFSMDISEYQKFKKNTLIYSMFSLTLLFFYLPLVGAAIYILFQIK